MSSLSSIYFSKDVYLRESSYTENLTRSPAVVGVKDELAAVYTFDGNRLLDEISGVFGGLLVTEVAAHDLAAPHIDDQVQVEEGSAHRTAQIGDVPRPDFIRATSDVLFGPMPSSGPRVLSMSELARFAQDSIEGRLARDVLPTIGQKWHDLPGRKVSILGTVGGRQHALTLLLREPVLSTRVGAASAIVGVAVETPTSDRSRGEPEQRRCFLASCSSPNGFVDELNDHSSLFGPVSSSSSPQIAWAFFCSTRSSLPLRSKQLGLTHDDRKGLKKLSYEVAEVRRQWRRPWLLQVALPGVLISLASGVGGYVFGDSLSERNRAEIRKDILDRYFAVDNEVVGKRRQILDFIDSTVARDDATLAEWSRHERIVVDAQLRELRTERMGLEAKIAGLETMLKAEKQARTGQAREDEAMRHKLAERFRQASPATASPDVQDSLNQLRARKLTLDKNSAPMLD